MLLNVWCWRRLFRVPWTSRRPSQHWIFIGKTDAEAPILWPPDAKSWLFWKDPDVGEVWGQKEKGMTEDEMIGWHHRINRHGFGWTPGVGDGQGGLACCISWGCKESDMTEQLNWTELFEIQIQLGILYFYLLSLMILWKEYSLLRIFITIWSQYIIFLCSSLIFIVSSFV